MAKKEKELLTYEDSKCSCCDKVYTAFFVINSSEWRDCKFVICSSCAMDVKDTLDGIQSKLDKKRR